jgi:hypothetical protein
MVWGALVILIWGITLIFLMLTLFFIKLKIARWIFGTIAMIFGIAPFALFWGNEKSRVDRQESFIGIYSNEETGDYIELHENLTWNSDTTLFECTNGNWRYIITEDMNFIELEGHCHDGSTFLQIYSATPDLLTFSPDQNTSRLKPKVELKRN